MPIEQALNILHIAMCDCLGYCRDLSYTPTQREIGLAIESLEEYMNQKNLP